MKNIFTIVFNAKAGRFKQMFLALGTTAVVLTTAFTQTDTELDMLLSRLEKLRGDYAQEKVYLQTDKPLYSIDEDIWLKGYVVTAEQNELSATSKILYVDLIDAQNVVRQSILLPIENGLAAANLHLNADLEAGNYRICAYTKWMENFSSDFFFRKDITVVNALPGAYNGELEYGTKAITAGSRLNTKIIYRGSDGTVAPGKTVAYTVFAGDLNVLEGKVITNADGSAAITGNIKDIYKNSVLRIHTALNTGDKRNIEQDFVLKPLATTADVQFFPEGGRLINGIRTKVAFKAIRPDGRSAQITGRVIDAEGTEVATLQSEHAGTGVFALQPQPQKTYTAVVKHEDGSEGRYALPLADNAGYVLNINQAGTDSLLVKVSASASLLDGRQAILIGQSSGSPKYIVKIKLNAASKQTYVPLSRFRTGIVQFTLFTPDYQPVAERLVFCDRNDQLNTDLKADKSIYAKREKVNLALNVSDVSKTPVVGSFSVAVTPAQVKNSEDDDNGILSNLLLTSDIKGYIEQPGYYFNPVNTNRYKHLDYLLLTQGWRRFNWADLKAGKYPQIKYLPEQGISISGTITSLTGKPLPNGKVTLFGKSTAGPVLIDTVADQNGRFTFKQLEFSDSARVIVKATNANDRNSVRVVLDTRPVPMLNSNYLLSGGNLSPEYLGYMSNQFADQGKRNVIALNEVKIKEKKDVFEERKTIAHSASLNPGKADVVIKADKFAQYSNLLQAFYGLPGVAVSENKLYAVRNTRKSWTAKDPSMQLIVDGAFVPKEMTAHVLSLIAPVDVLGAEILLGGSASIYGNDSMFGVVLLTTKKGGEDHTVKEHFNLAKLAPQGYHISKEFYSPVYDGSLKDSGMPDLRSTIYWNPNLVTDANGKANFSFYNADAVGTYKVTLEGLDTQGKLARKVYTYTVK